MINLTYTISTLNSVFTVVFYMTIWTKLDFGCICFENFINQLNLLYICSEWNFYILICFQIWCYFLYVPLIYVYFELKKVNAHFIILNFVIQSRSTVGLPTSTSKWGNKKLAVEKWISGIFQKDKIMHKCYPWRSVEPRYVWLISGLVRMTRS
jgi:hypothetical protein